MADITLKAANPFVGANLPVRFGAVQLIAAPDEPLFLITSATGQGLPDVGCGDAALFWFADNQWMTTQEDGVELTDMWPALLLTGEDADAVMARLCGLDLVGLKSGKVARVELAHAPAIILPVLDGYHIKLMRSFSGSAVQHIIAAMKSIAAQNLLD